MRVFDGEGSISNETTNNYVTKLSGEQTVCWTDMRQHLKTQETATTSHFYRLNKHLSPPSDKITDFPAF